DNKKYAATSRLTPPRRAAEIDRLSSDHRGNGVARVHRVGAHDPRHRLLVRIHVGSRHVLFWPNEVEQLCGITPRHALELAHGHLLRIADDSSLCTAEWNVDHRALPRHPRRERTHLVDIHIGRITDSAL